MTLFRFAVVVEVVVSDSQRKSGIALGVLRFLRDCLMCLFV
jgi:hypothetical protein